MSHKKRICLIDSAPDEHTIVFYEGEMVQSAENRDARIVALGKLILFSTETGDAWVLDAEDNLALCLARSGERQSFRVIETPNRFGIEWNATYRIDGNNFVVIDPEGHVRYILGYPTRALQQAIRRAG